MLKRLLSIKVRREERLMSDLGEVNSQIEASLAHEKKLQGDLNDNGQKWRSANQESVVAKKEPVNHALKHYRQFYEEKNRLEAEVNQNQAHRAQLATQREALQEALHRNRIEQEKFKYLIEHESTDST